MNTPQNQSVKHNCFNDIDIKNVFDKEVTATLNDFMVLEIKDSKPKQKRI